MSLCIRRVPKPDLFVSVIATRHISQLINNTWIIYVWIACGSGSCYVLQLDDGHHHYESRYYSLSITQLTFLHLKDVYGSRLIHYDRDSPICNIVELDSMQSYQLSVIIFVNNIHGFETFARLFESVYPYMPKKTICRYSCIIVHI